MARKETKLMNLIPISKYNKTFFIYVCFSEIHEKGVKNG